MINIPDDKANSNCIRIEGNKEGVKTAKEVILTNFLIIFNFQDYPVINDALYLLLLSESMT